MTNESETCTRYYWCEHGALGCARNGVHARYRTVDTTATTLGHDDVLDDVSVHISIDTDPIGPRVELAIEHPGVPLTVASLTLDELRALHAAVGDVLTAAEDFAHC